MGEHEPNRPARLLAALSTAAVAGVLLTSCAGLARAGTAVDPSETVVAPVTSAPASSAPAPDESSAAPTEQPSPQQTEAVAKAAVEPFITLPPTWNGEGVDVGALVPKIVETGGTCTATAERDGVTVAKSAAAVAASSYTGCPQLLITGHDLVPGTWTVTVAYSSADSAGTSKPASVTIR